MMTGCVILPIPGLTPSLQKEAEAGQEEQSTPASIMYGLFL